MFERKDGDLDELLSPHGQTKCTCCEESVVFWEGERDVWPFMCTVCKAEFVKTCEKKAPKETFERRYGIQTRLDDEYSRVPGIPCLDLTLSVVIHQRSVWETRAIFKNGTEPLLLGTYFEEKDAKTHAKWDANSVNSKIPLMEGWLQNETRGWREKVFVLPNGETYRFGARVLDRFDQTTAEIGVALSKLTSREQKLLRDYEW